jgi:heme/copper-type cytochrome/quinol oxidase subunit 1
MQKLINCIDDIWSRVFLIGCIVIIAPLMVFGGVEGMIRRWFTKDPGTGC